MKVVRAILVNDMDNCVTLAEFAHKGDAVSFQRGGEEATIAVREDIQIWHKMATSPVEKGMHVYKYGSVIGDAIKDIEAGDHVHVHNIRSPGD